MPRHDPKNMENFRHWMDKLFPIGTRVIDPQSNSYSVNDWFVLRDEIYVKLLQGEGTQATTYNVLFDEVMHWTRFPPEHEMTVSSACKNRISTRVRALLLLEEGLEKLRVNIKSRTGSIKNPVATLFKPRPTSRTGHPASHPYRCVSIRYPSDNACAAVKQFETLPRLSERPLPFLETRQRFLLSEGISLPLRGCTAAMCQCRFVHHNDRRVQEQHDQEDFMNTLSAAPFQERRRLRKDHR